MMIPYEAWLFAASWGSYMNDYDPGACMYGFSEDCKPQSEQHRQDCIDWIDKECLSLVRHNREDYDEDEEEKLIELIEYIKQADIGS